MHEGRREVSERERVNLFSGGPDELDGMNLEEAISWLDDLRGGFSRSDVFFKVEETGDPWDGYSQAAMTVWRYATEDEARAIVESRMERQQQRARDAEDRERAQLAALKAKYEGKP